MLSHSLLACLLLGLWVSVAWAADAVPPEPLTVNVTGTLRLEQPGAAPVADPDAALRAFTVFIPPVAVATHHPIIWANDYKRELRFTLMACYGHGEASTIIPMLKDTSDKSVVAVPCVCPANAWGACRLNGSPTILSFSTETTCTGGSCVLSVKREGLPGEGAVSLRVQGMVLP